MNEMSPHENPLATAHPASNCNEPEKSIELEVAEVIDLDSLQPGKPSMLKTRALSTPITASFPTELPGVFTRKFRTRAGFCGKSA